MHMIVYHELSSLCHDLGYTPKTLYTLSNQIGKHYHAVTIPKKSGGVRILHVPDPLLKSVQRSIADNLLAYMPVSEYACAYRYGMSAARSAAAHTGKDTVMRLDIRGFFDHITFAQIREKVFSARRFSEANSILLTVLCVYEDILPQGAPTSPMISNLILRGFDDVMGEWCRKRGITYTRYCDDMTFSGTFDAREVKEKAAALLRKEGFFLNGKKTMIRHRGQRQFTTGLVVNEMVSVPAGYRRKIRQEMHCIETFGLLSHMEHAGIREDPEAYLRSLQGRIRYVLSVSKSQEFRNYDDRISRLLKKETV